MGPGWVPGIAPLQAHPVPTTPGTPLPPLPVTMLHATATGTAPGGVNMVVGLISVRRLSLDGHFSDIRGITERYNLVRIDRINNHLVILGKE